MKNRNEKGRLIEVRAIHILVAQGYTVHHTERTSHKIGPNRWISNRNDIFGCIDIIAMKAGERTRYIQVTCDRNIGRKVAELSTVPWTPANQSVEVWRWVPGGGKRLDGRTGLPRLTQYFEIYDLDHAFARRGRRES